jgi:hypothetical protein
LNKPSLSNKLKKKNSISNFINLKNTNSANKFDIHSSSNQLYNKSISLTSTLTKANTNSSNINTSSQKKLTDKNKRINRCFTSNDIKKTKSKTKYQKNNLFINTMLFTDNTQKEKITYYPSYNKYKRSKSNDSFYKYFSGLKNFSNNTNTNISNKKKILLRNNFFRRSKSKKDLNILNNYNNNEIINVLLNRYPNIEKHRKMKFNSEIKHIIKNMNKESNEKNKNNLFCCSQNNLITPYKILNKNIFNKFSGSSPHLNDENIYKFNIVANSKILDINDIQQNNINNFFNTEKYYNYKRSSSLENLKMVINNRSPKYISDCFCNNNIYNRGIKIYNYKSKKLREIYEELV